MKYIRDELSVAFCFFADVRAERSRLRSKIAGPALTGQLQREPAGLQWQQRWVIEQLAIEN